MKSRFLFLILVGALAAISVIFSPTSTTAQVAAADDEGLKPVLAELQTQQTALADNQKKIDEKIAAIAEELRQARIFTSRGGR